MLVALAKNQTMKTAMESAIEHFDSINPNMHLSTTQIMNILGQFIAKEKEQIIDAYIAGDGDLYFLNEANPEKYYNETYNKK